MRRWLIVFICLSTSTARAYRPFDGTDADVAALGEFEAEVGPLGYLRADKQNYLTTANLVLNLGFYERLELVVQATNFLALDAHPGLPTNQIGDAGVFIKSVLREGNLQNESGPSIALEIGPIWPSVWPGPQLGGSGAVIVSMRWPSVTLHFNHEARLGNTIGQVPGQSSLYLVEETGLIVEGPDHWRIRPVLEALVDYTFSAVEARSALLGGIWRLSEEWVLDIAARVGDQAGDMQYEIRAGFTWTAAVWAT